MTDKVVRTSAEIKEEILVEVRNIILYREKLQAPTTRIDYEELQKTITAFAGAVYHFDERLHAWVKKSKLNIKPSIEEIAKNSTGIQVCGDLFNTKKHGASGNWSKLSPHLSAMELNPAGVIGLKYDGVMKTGELDRAIPYRIEIHCSENRTLGDAVRFVAKAFSIWVPIMEQLGLLKVTDDYDRKLLSRLAEFASDSP